MGCDWRARFELRNPTGGVVRTFLQCVKYVKLQCFRRRGVQPFGMCLTLQISCSVLGNPSRNSGSCSMPGNSSRSSDPSVRMRSGTRAGETGSGMAVWVASPPGRGESTISSTKRAVCTSKGIWSVLTSPPEGTNWSVLTSPPEGTNRPVLGSHQHNQTKVVWPVFGTPPVPVSPARANKPVPEEVGPEKTEDVAGERIDK